MKIEFWKIVMMMSVLSVCGCAKSKAKQNVATVSDIGSYPWVGRSTSAAINNNGAMSAMEYQMQLKTNPSIRESSKYTDFPVRVPSVGNCPCTGDNKCMCGANGPIQTECPCSPKPSCPPCIVAKTMRQMHQLASEFAKEDQETQGGLQKESVLQKRLFEQAQKYAHDAEEEEEIAKKLSMELQIHSSKAQIDRNKMIRAENQAKQIALDAIRTMTIHPPHEATGIPGMKIERTGTKVNTIVEKTPYYNLHIGKTDPRGFLDQTAQSIHEDMKRVTGDTIDNPFKNRFTKVTQPTDNDNTGLDQVAIQSQLDSPDTQ